MDKYLKLKDGVELRYRDNKIEDAKGVILINHGFAEHMGRYDYVAKRFNEEGFSVYRYDLRGHGKTKSKKGHIDSYKEFIEDCHEMVSLIKRENKDMPLYMLGHSMGGFVTCLYGINYPDELDGQIFSGPAVNTLPAASGIKRVGLKLLKKIMPNKTIANIVEDDICSVEEVVEDYKKDPLVLKEATVNFYNEFLIEGVKYIEENINKYNYPCLICHGEKDKIVPKEIGYYLYDNISSKDKEIKIYKDLYHEILNERERDNILDDMIVWINKHLEEN